ncbi:MAG: glycosyl transferase, partial [Oscillospiraceae bacterium]|nr:glycosyl transferase [Oscillospiraceae bacterium]
MNDFTRNCSNWPLPALNRNYAFILSVYKSLNEDTRKKLPVPAAAQWLLDNFYIISKQVQELRLDLNKKSYLRLPVLNENPRKGHTRIYAAAADVSALTNGRMDETALSDYLKAYQEENTLSEREIEAIPLAVKLVLIENLRFVCENIQETRLEWRMADETFKNIAVAFSKDSKRAAKKLNEYVGEFASAPAYIEHLHYRLRRSETGFAEIVRALDLILKTQGTSVERITRKEHNAQSLTTVSICNTVTSLRYFAVMDWEELLRSSSELEKVLSGDPDGSYSEMDKTTRGRYRKKSEALAARYRCSELHVAAQAIRLAENAQKEKESAPARSGSDGHVGYYLAGKGLPKLEACIAGGRGRRPRSALSGGGARKILYFTAIGGVVSALFFAAALYVGLVGGSGWPVALLAGFAVLIPASEFAAQMVNRLVCTAVKPEPLPKMELKEGIPADLGTVVVIPTLLPHAERVRELLDTLESHYLSNRDDHLYFALLGAFKDAAAEHSDDDDAVIDTALSGIKQLNQTYAAGKKDKFYFYHRGRQYNESNHVWIGWERKRGALLEFGRMLMGLADTSFAYMSCVTPPTVKYVITLDSDTILPMGAARALAGTMAHPLNSPAVDAERGTVREGYGILQPRIDVDVECAGKTVFSRIFTTQDGLDPYSGAISDVYQDMFGEGIFTGKGIYDLGVYQRILTGAFPENTVLSHDLLEGSYLRAGLVTDIRLVDTFPTGYNTHSSRQLRWIRGDWQLLPHLMPRIRTGNGKKITNPLSPLSRWKIADNLRRSLVAPALMLLILLALTVLPGSALFWTGALLVVAFLPFLFTLSASLPATLPFRRKTKRYVAIFSALKSSLVQGSLVVAFLPYQAWQSVSGIFVTLVRLATGKNLLAWVTAADTESAQKNTPGSYLRMMGSVYFLTIAALIPVILYHAEVAWLFLPLLLIWALSPLLAYVISRAENGVAAPIPELEQTELGRIARKTWRYFEEFATEKNHYLAPDNVQLDPPKGVARRTSPTNIGFGLMATLTARDFGYIGTPEMTELLDKTLTTVESLQKWNGHLYNWYDTRTLIPMKPEYISTVDSGNLSGYLITLEQGLRQYLKRPPDGGEFLNGVRDTLNAAGADGAAVWRSVSAAPDPLEELSRTDWAPRIKSGEWRAKLEHMLERHRRETADFLPCARMLESLAERVAKLWADMTFIPLYDKKKALFSIGYNIAEEKLTASYYDLLASEARQASYIAIATGEVPVSHWFRMGRALTVTDRYKGLASWTGTMFEYLMPLLIMKSYRNTLLDETCHFAVRCQKKYGKLRNMPWGASESCFYSLDTSHDYQYKAIGVPWLGLKRGLTEDAVTAPYATFLALSVDPVGASENIHRLKKEGLEGPYGLFEAADYTPERLVFEPKRAVIKSFMAHHQGMSLVALNNHLHGDIMRERFHSNPAIHAARLLLQEKTPAGIPLAKTVREKVEPVRRETRRAEVIKREPHTPDPALPRTHILTNGNYSVMLTERGTGYSKSKMAAVTRWREDRTLDPYGMFIYLRNSGTGDVWSATRAPVDTVPDKYQVLFESDKAVFTRSDGSIDTKTEVTVASGDNTEIRRVILKNNGTAPAVIEITSYFEVVIAPLADDMAHPAFSNLFVETAFDADRRCITASRRPRSDGEKQNWLAHTIVTDGGLYDGLQFETDRMQFLGRGHTGQNPDGLRRGKPLSGTIGAVLDPCASLRVRVSVKPGKSARVSFITIIGGSREHVLARTDTYRRPDGVRQAFQLALQRGRIEAQFRDLNADKIKLYQELISHILFISPSKRKHSGVILQNKSGQSSLWKYEISGDMPIVLLHLNEENQAPLLYEVLLAHEYWRLMDVKVDLVILCDEEYGYHNSLYRLIADIVSSHKNTAIFHSPKDTFVIDK